MTRFISDKAEVALEYPDKFYSGTFERSSRFEVSLDATGVLLVLERPGSADVRKSVHIHINYGLLADILQQMSSQVSKIPMARSIVINCTRRLMRSTEPWKKLEAGLRHPLALSSKHARDQDISGP
jgi:hypothetical protein